mmetsp:Transcript_20928/g.69868  ORF Transcript_20928/g.69868 Transcript_20928/m.69868 type:complete len:286 (+) Transcript_20928:102-959(+)
MVCHSFDQLSLDRGCILNKHSLGLFRNLSFFTLSRSYLHLVLVVLHGEVRRTHRQTVEENIVASRKRSEEVEVDDLVFLFLIELDDPLILLDRLNLFLLRLRLLTSRLGLLVSEAMADTRQERGLVLHLIQYLSVCKTSKDLQSIFLAKLRQLRKSALVEVLPRAFPVFNDLEEPCFHTGLQPRGLIILFLRLLILLLFIIIRCPRKLLPVSEHEHRRLPLVIVLISVLPFLLLLGVLAPLGLRRLVLFLFRCFLLRFLLIPFGLLLNFLLLLYLSVVFFPAPRR